LTTKQAETVSTLTTFEPSLREPPLTSFANAHDVVRAAAEAHVPLDGEILPPLDSQDSPNLPGIPPPIAKTKPRAQAKRAYRLPNDWSATAEMVDFALNEGLTDDEARREERNIRDWSLSARDGARCDWFAAWRIWIRRVAPRIIKARTAFAGGHGQARVGRLAEYQRAAAYLSQKYDVP
jgi:hypothetical protein